MSECVRILIINILIEENVYLKKYSTLQQQKIIKLGFNAKNNIKKINILKL